MAINFTTVKTALVSWCSSVVGGAIPVVIYEPNAPRPSSQYVTINVSSIVSYGQDWSTSGANSLGEVGMKGDRLFTVGVQVYGGDALTLAENIRTSLQKQTVLDGLRTNAIAFYQAMTINDITELVDSRFEKRAQLDVQFGIGQIYVDSPGFFNQIEVEEIIKNVDSEILYSDTILISSPTP